MSSETLGEEPCQNFSFNQKILLQLDHFYNC